MKVKQNFNKLLGIIEIISGIILIPIVIFNLVIFLTKFIIGLISFLNNLLQIDIIAMWVGGFLIILPIWAFIIFIKD